MSVYDAALAAVGNVVYDISFYEISEISRHFSGDEGCDDLDGQSPNGDIVDAKLLPSMNLDDPDSDAEYGHDGESKPCAESSYIVQLADESLISWDDVVAQRGFAGSPRLAMGEVISVLPDGLCASYCAIAARDTESFKSTWRDNRGFFLN